jgi:hypothetical protein
MTDLFPRPYLIVDNTNPWPVNALRVVLGSGAHAFKSSGLSQASPDTGTHQRGSSKEASK